MMFSRDGRCEGCALRELLPEKTDALVAGSRQTLAFSVCSGHRGQSPTVRCPHGNRCQIDMYDRRFIMLPSPEVVPLIVRYGNAMGVSVQVGQRRPGFAERGLGVDHPFRLVKRGESGGERVNPGQPAMFAEECQMPRPIGSSRPARIRRRKNRDSTAVMPIRAPRRLGLAARVITVAADARNNRS